MRLSFLIAAHAYPELLARLVERIQRPFTSIFIHIDKGADIRLFQTVFEKRNIRDIHWVPRVHSGWATFGQVKASLSLLRQALYHDKESERFILISGQDYPLSSPEVMLEFFRHRKHVNFISCFPLPFNGWSGNGGFDRIRHHHFTFSGFRFEFPCVQVPSSRRIYLAYQLCRLLLPRTRSLPENIRFFGGGNWWDLTREAAEAIIEYTKQNPGFSRIFRFSKSSDEIFFQTILMNSGRQWILDNNILRSVFWDGRHNEYPSIVRLSDFDELVQSGKFFARKIHPEHSLSLINRIDRELLACKN
ncbi:MAG: hypothetical protein HQM09_17710 [Candidatus Riflebacteria bacterium]|nr:hypothetical protein [Candidatus Riflebacteria bacterium]